MELFKNEGAQSMLQYKRKKAEKKEKICFKTDLPQERCKCNKTVKKT